MTLYVLDTNIILTDHKSILGFGTDTVILPLTVIKELEKKRTHPELGYQARKALHLLEDLRIDNEVADFAFPLCTPDGGSLQIRFVEHGNDNDDMIINCAIDLQKDDVILVSNDLPMRILAGLKGITTQTYQGSFSKDEFLGFQELEVEFEITQQLYKNGLVEGNFGPINSGVVLKAGTQSAIAVQGTDAIHLISDNEVFGVKARSVEQKFAVDALANPCIPIVSLSGIAGSGKTSLAILAGLEAVMENKEFKKVVVFRPLYPVGGQELGFLPGTAEEKLAPWAEAVNDVLEALVEPLVIEEVLARKILEVQPLTYIRGRTFTDTWVIVDEAQNLDYNVLKTVLTRLGKGSKMILCSDVSQSDNRFVGKDDGIAAVTKKLSGNPMFAHFTFSKSERSDAAAMVAKLLG